MPIKLLVIVRIEAKSVMATFPAFTDEWRPKMPLSVILMSQRPENE